MDVGFISTHFFDFCLYFSAPLVLVIFENLSMLKREGRRSTNKNTHACVAMHVSASQASRPVPVEEHAAH